MDSLTIIAAICAVPAAIGVALDRFLLRRTKSALYDSLLYMWDRLDETSVPNLPQLMATTTLTAGSRLLGITSGWFHVAGCTMLISFVLTYSALWIGSSFDLGRIADPLIAAKRYQGGLFLLLLINLLFDFLTAFVTWHVLRFVQRHGFLVSLAAILADTVVAIALAYSCGTAALWLGSEMPSSVDFVARAHDCLACAWSMRRGAMDEFTVAPL